MRRSIFIIDDNPEIRELIISSLEHLSELQFRSFSNPAAVLRRIDAHQLPDLIITDLRMGQMNGIEFLMRLSQQHPEMHAIIFTGQPQSLPPACNYPVVFKDIHGFDRLVHEVETLLNINQTVSQDNR